MAAALGAEMDACLVEWAHFDEQEAEVDGADLLDERPATHWWRVPLHLLPSYHGTAGAARGGGKRRDSIDLCADEMRRCTLWRPHSTFAALLSSGVPFLAGCSSMPLLLHDAGGGEGAPAQECTGSQSGQDEQKGRRQWRAPPASSRLRFWHPTTQGSTGDAMAPRLLRLSSNLSQQAKGPIQRAACLLLSAPALLKQATLPPASLRVMRAII